MGTALIISIIITMSASGFSLAGAILDKAWLYGVALVLCVINLTYLLFI